MAFGSDVSRIWAIRRQESDRIIKSGRVEIKKVDRRIHVTCVHRDEFTKGARELLGVWRDKSQCWTFGLPAKRLVVELVERVYGKEAIDMVGFPAE